MNFLQTEKNSSNTINFSPRYPPSYSKIPNTTELDMTDVLGVKMCELNNNHINKKFYEKKNFKKTKPTNPDYLTYMHKHKHDFTNDQPPILSLRNDQCGSDSAVEDPGLQKTDRRNPRGSVYEIRKKYTSVASQVRANQKNSR